jgi:hypothetical protein
MSSESTDADVEFLREQIDEGVYPAGDVERMVEAVRQNERSRGDRMRLVEVFQEFPPEIAVQVLWKVTRMDVVTQDDNMVRSQAVLAMEDVDAPIPSKPER